MTDWGRRILARFTIAGFCALQLAFGAAAGAQSFATIEIESDAFGGARPILVHLPESYETESRRYPVLYVLNGEENFQWASDIADFLAARAEIDEMIVVGLPDQGDYSRDNFPFAEADSLEPNPGAESYAAFLRNEVIPYVEDAYRTEDSRFIVGHSLSGVFVTNLFRTDPDEFNVYIIVSPSYHYAPQMIDLMRERLDSGDETGAVYLTIGALEHTLIQEQFSRMREVFETHAPDDMIWAVDSISYNNHRSAAHAGLYDGLSWAYRGWGTDESMAAAPGGVDGIVAHYDALSDMLGYEIAPAEGDLAGLGGFLLGRRDDPQGAAIAYAAELHYFPNSEEGREGLAAAEAAEAAR